jgi:nucleotide-binding universal stress UspA family protein
MTFRARSHRRDGGFSFRTILVPHDLTPVSTLALARAAELAALDGGRLHVLHVASANEPALALDGALPIGPQDALESDRAVESLVRSLAREVGVAAEVHIEHGSPAPTICAVAERISADLIVMGTHAGAGRQGLFRGSIAARTVRRAPCPVFTVRPPRVRPVND